jgi:Ca2+-binding EF-hand superfamily protein
MLLEKTIGIKYEDIADKNRTEDDRITKRKKEGHKYITYEEFYKYCKKYFPELKDKELISIFNRLDPEGHGVISVEELNILLKENSRKSQ